MNSNFRLTVFDWLKNHTLVHGEVLDRRYLEHGLHIEGNRITLIGPKGIWKPKSFKYPISITTTAKGPYNDELTKDGFLKYSYRGTDPYHPDNVGLREMMTKGIPLIYFHAIVPGNYLAAWPVFIQDDDMPNLTFIVAVDEIKRLGKVEEPAADYGRRSYLTTQIRIRVHQQKFRERVLAAYNSQCTLCNLKHRELLDAAHIIPDGQPTGQPVIQNGLTLCKIHHAAFDANIIGITPDYLIRIREDILHEIDGPMLKYGIQSLNNRSIQLPRRKHDWPDKTRLEFRFINFLEAC